MDESPSASPMLRYTVAFLSLSVGILVAGADMAITSATKPPQQGVAARPGDADKAAFDACVTLYGVTYAMGRLLYRIFGASREARELRQWSRWHMAVLNVVGGGWLVGVGWQALQQAKVFRPSLVVGLILLGLAAWDGWRSFRSARPEV